MTDKHRVTAYFSTCTNLYDLYYHSLSCITMIRITTTSNTSPWSLSVQPLLHHPVSILQHQLSLYDLLQYSIYNATLISNDSTLTITLIYRYSIYYVTTISIVTAYITPLCSLLAQHLYCHSDLSLQRSYVTMPSRGPAANTSLYPYLLQHLLRHYALYCYRSYAVPMILTLQHI